jgi:hypothetical protein
VPVQAIKVLRSGENRLSQEASTRVYGLEVIEVKLPRKARWHVKSDLPVPETDTGGVVENTEGREITLSKELGKMAP